MNVLMKILSIVLAKSRYITIFLLIGVSPGSSFTHISYSGSLTQSGSLIEFIHTVNDRLITAQFTKDK